MTAHAGRDPVREFKKALKRPFKKVIFLLKDAVARAMSESGEWLVYNAQRFSPYKFRSYQPMPWIGLTTRKRDASTLARWEAIENNLDITHGSALDIGCNLGYFTLRLAEKGFYGIGIDTEYGNVKIAQYAQRKAGIGNAAFSNMSVTPGNVALLPEVDVLILFSVWHHWIVAYGHAKALEMLSVVWGKTRHVMFFESGEDTEIQILEIREEPAHWVRTQLEQACPDGTITVIGKFSRGTHMKTEQTRTLFAVYR